MQITVKESKVAKTGSNSKGEWQLIVVKDSNTGIDYTTFDKKALTGPGSVLEIGKPDVKDGKFSFKKCEIISSAPASVTNSRETSPEEWREKQRIERASFEAQTAFKGIIDLAVAWIGQGKDPRAMDEVKEPLALAMGWADKRLAITVKEALKIAPHLDKEKPAPATEKIEELFPEEFKNVGEFLSWAVKKYKANSSDIMAALEVNKPADVNNFEVAKGKLEVAFKK